MTPKEPSKEAMDFVHLLLDERAITPRIIEQVPEYRQLALFMAQAAQAFADKAVEEEREACALVAAKTRDYAEAQVAARPNASEPKIREGWIIRSSAALEIMVGIRARARSQKDAT